MLFAVAGVSHAEPSRHEQEAFNHEAFNLEPEVIKGLLMQAANAEHDAKGLDSD